MNTIVVRKEALREIVAANREMHRDVFLQALDGFKNQLEENLRYKIKALEEGKIPELRIALVQPEDHTKDYDRILRMIDMEVGDEIEITQGDFARYVEDDWDWKAQFVNVSNTYTAAAWDGSPEDYAGKFGRRPRR